MRTTDNSFSQTPIIDLKDCIVKLLKQWKPLVVTILIFSLLCCSAKHHKDIKAFKAQQKSAETTNTINMDNLSEKELLQSLSETEKALVIDYVQQYIWLRDEEDYVRNSILMREDPANQRAVIFNYAISSNDETYNNYDMNILLSGYLHSTAFAEKISSVIDPSAEPGTMIELIKDRKKNDFIDSDAKTYSFSIIVLDNTDIDMLTKEVTEAITSFADVNKGSLHINSIKLVNSYETRFMNTEVFYLKKIANDSIRDAYNTVNNLKSSLNEKQLSVANAIIAQNTRTKDTKVSDNTDAETTDPQAPGYSLKYAFAGGILGLITYLVLFLALYLRKDLVGSMANAKSIIDNVRFIGCIIDDNKSGNSFFSSKAVSKIINRNTPGIEVQVSRIAASIETACKYLNVNQITLISLKAIENGAYELLRERLDNRGITADLVPFIKGDEIIDESAYASIDNGILLVREDDKQTTWRSVINISEYYEIRYIGAIYVACA